MLAKTTRDPASLRRAIDSLAKDSRAGVAVALAEAHFRLAIHPATERDETLTSLYQAVRLDSANPKLAYHLARFFFVHGELDRAADWLTRARKLSPTSHRIVAHIAFLQRELNERYKDDTRWDPDALRARSERLTRAIRNEEDQFADADLDLKPELGQAEKERLSRMNLKVVPPTAAPAPAPAATQVVKRTLDAQTCRWSGVIDAEAEWLLAALPTERTRNVLLPVLERIVHCAPARHGGTAGFALFGIQWLLAGYSADSLRRVAGELLAQRGDPGIELLVQVIEIFDATPAEIPGQLVALVQTGQMPAELAATIHYRLLMWQPMTFAATTAFRKAVAGGGDTNALIRELNAALTSFCLPRPQPIPDKCDEAKGSGKMDATRVAEALAQLHVIGNDLVDAKSAAFAFLKDQLEPRSTESADANHFAVVQADLDLYRDVLASLESASDAGIATVEFISLSMSHLSDEPNALDLSKEREACKGLYADLKALGNFKKPLSRVARNLGGHAEQLASQTDPEPSPELLTLLARMQSAAPPQALAPPRKLSGIDAELARADDMDQRVASEWNSLKSLQQAHKVTSIDPSDLALRRITDFVAEIEQVAKTGLERVEQLRGDTDPERLRGLVDKLRGLASQPGRFRKGLGKLPTPPAKLEPSSSTAADDERPPPASSDLATVIDQVRTCVAARFAKLDRELDAYEPILRGEPPLRALRQLVRSRHAELLYRMGEYAAARRIWASLVALDPISPLPRKNIAVHDTLHGDAASALAQWRGYAESLYLFPIVSGDPRQMAEERAELHAAFAGAYVAAGVLATPSREESDEQRLARRHALRSAVADECAFVGFVAHKRLELVTRKLAARSPSVVLGVARDATDNHRDKAATRLAFLAKQASSALCGALAEAAAEMWTQTIEQARKRASVAKQRIAERDPTYEEDHAEYVKWLDSVLTMKMGLLIQLYEDGAWTEGLRSTKFLLALASLDEIPLDLDKQLALAIANKCDRAQALSVSLTQVASNQIVSHLREQADATTAREVHRRLVDGWQDHPSLSQLARWLDFPDGMKGLAALPDGDDAAALEEPLRSLHANLPRSVTVRLQLAQVLASRNANADALSLARAAASDGLTEELRDHASKLIEQLETRNQLDGHRQRLEAMLDMRPESEVAARQLADQLGALLSEVEADANQRPEGPVAAALCQLAEQIRGFIGQADAAHNQLVVRAQLEGMFDEYRTLLSNQPRSASELRQLRSALMSLRVRARQSANEPVYSVARSQLDQLIERIDENLGQIDQAQSQL